MTTSEERDNVLIEAVQELFAYVLGPGAAAFKTDPARVLEEHEIPNDPAALVPALETVANQASFERNVQQGVNNTTGGGGGGGTPSPPHPDPSKPPVETIKEYVNYFETNNYETHNFYKDESINVYGEEGADIDIDRIENEDGVVINDSEVEGPVNNVHGDGNITGDEILKDVTTGQNSPIVIGNDNETKIEDQDVEVTLPPGYGTGVQVAVTGGKDNESHIDQKIDNEDEEPAYPTDPPPTDGPIRFEAPSEEHEPPTSSYEAPEQESESESEPVS